jgi:hypothetical protein
VCARTGPNIQSSSRLPCLTLTGLGEEIASCSAGLLLSNDNTLIRSQTHQPRPRSKPFNLTLRQSPHLLWCCVTFSRTNSRSCSSSTCSPAPADRFLNFITRGTLVAPTGFSTPGKKSTKTSTLRVINPQTTSSNMSVEAATAQMANTSLTDAPSAQGASADDKTTSAGQNEAVAASAAEGRRLYIGNLAYATTEGELKDFFKDYLVYAFAPAVHISSILSSDIICTGKLPQFPQTRALPAPSAMPLLTYPLHRRPSAPLMN